MGLVIFKPVKVVWAPVTNVRLGLFSSLDDLRRAALDVVAKLGNVHSSIDDVKPLLSRKIITDSLARGLSWLSGLTVKFRLCLNRGAVDRACAKYLEERFPSQYLNYKGRDWKVIDEFPK